MTSTIEITGTGVSCSGRNHSDHGTFVVCPQCGTLVIRGAKGQLAQPTGTSGRRFYCWTKHECSDMMVEFNAFRNAEKMAEGKPAIGAPVEVVKGRKIALGTEGIVRVVDESGQWGTRVALSIEGEERLVWTAAANVAITDVEVLAEAQATVDAYHAKHDTWTARLAEIDEERAALTQERRDLFSYVKSVPEGSERQAAYDEAQTRMDAQEERLTALLAEITSIQAERGW